MKCPTCEANCQRSIVRITRTTSGDLKRDHFFDEDGAEHSHNPNVVVTEYSCSNGHRFAERSSWECHCGYKACVQEIMVVSEAEPAPVVASGSPVRSSSGKVITAAERKALNEKKGAR